MPLPIPNLDDRDYARLLADARAIIAARTPDWTDLSPGDPGVTLLELFAFLTENVIFRLNRLPAKARIALLDLAGVSLLAPAAARTDLVFGRAQPADEPVTIPRGTRVATARADGPVFVTTAAATIQPGATTIVVGARHVVPHLDVLGTTSGRPFQRFTAPHAPLVLDDGDDALVVGTEVDQGEFDERVPAARLGDGLYRLLHEVPRLGPDSGPDAFVVDRGSGTITLGDADPSRRPVGRRVCAAYRTGGGAAGNVRAGLLTTLADPIAGLTVTNPAPATGGRDAESLASAVERGGHELHAGGRVVTARDYEGAAVRAHGGVSRATVHTTAELWPGGTPGDVSVLLVPSASAAEALTLTPDDILARQVPDVPRTVGRHLAERHPLGVTCSVGWVGWKRFHVEATAVVHRAEDLDAVTARLTERLARTLTPFPVDDRPGWGFGEPLRASTVYDVLLAERGVRYVTDVRLVVDEVPADVAALVADPHAPGTSFCAGDERIFRTTDGAGGWELVHRLPGERVERLSACPGRPGLLVASTRLGDREESRLHVSRDHGETWAQAAEFAFHVEDLAAAATWAGPAAFLATDKGLFRLLLEPGAAPESVLIAAEDPDRACYAVAVVSEPDADLQLAVATQQLGGVFCSFQAGRSGTFQPLGLTGVDVRLLRVRRSPGRRFLLAGAYATGDEPGAGVQQIELKPYQPSPEGWQPVGTAWVGGSCRDLAAAGERVFAATSRSGVTVADASGAAATPWREASVDSGLPLQEVGRFRPVHAVAIDGRQLLAGSVGGVWASGDGRTWSHVSGAVFTDRIALPRTWLFAPGEHILHVGYDDARG